MLPIEDAIAFDLTHCLFARTGDYLAVFCPLDSLLSQVSSYADLRAREQRTRLLFFPISYVLERELA